MIMFDSFFLYITWHLVIYVICDPLERVKLQLFLGLHRYTFFFAFTSRLLQAILAGLEFENLRCRLSGVYELMKLLMVQKSETTTIWMVIRPCK